MQRVWALTANPNRRKELLRMKEAEISFVENIQDLQKMVSEDELLVLLAPIEKISEAEKILQKKILAIWPWSDTGNDDEFLFALQSVLRESRLQHDLNAAESVAWNSADGGRYEDPSIELVGESVLVIAACRSMEAVEKELLRACSTLAKVEDVRVVMTPGFLPAKLLGKFQLAIPIQFQSDLQAHVYVKFFPDHSEKLEKISSFILGLGDAISLAVERNRMILQAEKTKAVWEASFDAVEDPVVILDEEFIILRANRAFGKLIHTPISRVQGKECQVVSGVTLRAMLEKNIQEWDLPYEENTYHVFFDQILEPLGTGRFVLRFHDVSAERALAEKILSREQIAEMGILASSVAHEINNPIGGIIALSQLILRDFDKRHPLYEDLSAILEAAERCKKIVQTMLSLVRKADEEKKSTDVVECIRLAKEIIESEAKRLVIQIHWHEPENGKIIFMANKNRLIQVFFHLLQQSIHAVVERKKTEKFFSHIKIYFENLGAQVGIFIEDNGAPDIHVYDSGSSVSFAVSKMIVEEHAGTIELHCDEERNQLKLTFPVSDTVL